MDAVFAPSPRTWQQRREEEFRKRQQIDEKYLEPVVARCSLRTHPDKILRKIGVIHDRIPVYKPKKKRDDESNDGSSHSEGVQEQEVHEQAVKGVVYICGELRPTTASGEADTQTVARIQKEKQRVDDDDDSTPVPLTDLESLKVIQHYIQIGLPELARRSSSCIIADAEGVLAEELSKGIDASISRHPYLIGVGGASAKSDIGLNSSFTHHIIVEPDIGSTSAFLERHPLPLGKPKSMRRHKRAAERVLVCPGFECNNSHGDHRDVDWAPTGRIFRNHDDDNFDRNDPRDHAIIKLSDDSELRKCPASVTEALVRQCECGTMLTFDEIAICKCGRYDFQHICPEAKANRMRTIKEVLPETCHTKSLLHELSHFSVDPAGCVPSKRDVHRYKLWLAATITAGFSRDTRQSLLRSDVVLPPERQNCPIISILIGGDVNYEKYHLAQQVSKRWPIIIIEGSGGYADVLCDTINKVRNVVNSRKEDIEEEAGIDHFRQYLSGIDSITAEIIINGDIQIASRGLTTNEFTRKVENALKGNETLEESWILYSRWRHNAAIWRGIYFKAEIVVVLLSILTTFASTLQTFLLLIWKYIDVDKPAFPPDSPDFGRLMFNGLQWAGIILPIMLTFFQGIGKQQRAGPKWVRLEAAAELLLSEIYKYRSQTLEYSKDAISKRKSAGAKYITREEFLQSKCSDLITLLTNSEVVHATLENYTGPIPPPHIRDTGDDGFTELGPEQYQLYRVEAKMNELQRKCTKFGRHNYTYSLLIQLLNASGSLIAAVATYGLGYVQPWVTLVICLATNIAKWMDNVRFSVLIKRMNLTQNNLSNVSMWWVSQIENVDNQNNRDYLVDAAEKTILDEALHWGLILEGNVGEDDSTSKPTNANPPEDKPPVDETAQLEEAGKRYGLDLTTLSIKSLLEATQTDNISDKTTIKQSVDKVLNLLVDPKTAIKSSNSPHQQRSRLRTSLLHTLHATSPTTDTSTSNISALKAIQLKPEGRDRLITALLTILSKRITVNKYNILHELQDNTPELHSYVDNLGTRELLDILKRISVEAFLDLLITHLVLDANVEVTREDIIGGLSTGRSAFGEALLSELWYLSDISIPKRAGNRFSRNTIECAIRDDDVRMFVRRQSDRVVASLMDFSLKHWGGKELTTTAQFLYEVVKRIGEMDIDEFLGSIPTRLEVATAKYSASSLRLQSRDTIIAGLPKELSRQLNGCSRMLLDQYLINLSFGSPVSRIFTRSSCSRIDKLLPTVIFSVRPGEQGNDMKERLSLCVAELDQIIINRFSREQLMKRLQLCEASNEESQNIFVQLQDPKLRFLLSVMQSAIAGTPSSRMIDQLADEILSFDVRLSIPYSLSEKLSLAMHEFRIAPPHQHRSSEINSNPILNINNLSKESILKLLHKSLKPVLSQLTQTQLRELIQGTLVICNSFVERVHRLLMENDFVRRDSHLRVVVASWDSPHLEHLLARVSESSAIADLVDGERYSESDEEIMKLTDTLLNYSKERLLVEAFDSVAVTFSFCESVSQRQFHILTRPLFMNIYNQQILLRLLSRLDSMEVHKILKEDTSNDENQFMYSDDEVEEEQEPTHSRLLQLLVSVIDESNNQNSGIESDLISLLIQIEGSLTHLVVSVLVDLSYETPLRLFYELSRRLVTFDLRDVINGSHRRRQFVILMFDLIQGGDVSPADSINCKHKDMISDWMGRPFPYCEAGETSGIAYKKRTWKTHFIQLASQCHNGRFAEVVNDIRHLTESQLKVAFEEFFILLSQSAVGVAFSKYLSKAKKDNPSWDSWVLMYETVADLRLRLKTLPRAVYSVFQDFNVSRFVHKSRSQKLSSLNELELTAESQRLIADLPANRLREEIFTYLHTYKPVTRTQKLAFYSNNANKDLLWFGGDTPRNLSSGSGFGSTFRSR